MDDMSNIDHISNMDNRVWNKIDSTTMVYGGQWEDARSTIRAHVFGVMINLARDRVKNYKSDLYHDALWLSEWLIGPMRFDWIARESGTFIGAVVQHITDSEWEDTARYRFEIREDNRSWKLNLYEAGPLSIPVPNVPDTSTGVVVEEGAVLIETEKVERFCNEPLPENVVEALVNTSVNPINWTPPKVAEIVIDYESGMFHKTGAIPSVKGVGINPTPRNEVTNNNRKVINMDDIIRDLREKLAEASTARDDAQNAKYNLDEFISELEDYSNSVDELIDQLQDLPTVSVSFEVDLSFYS